MQFFKLGTLQMRTSVLDQTYGLCTMPSVNKMTLAVDKYFFDLSRRCCYDFASMCNAPSDFFMGT